MYGLIAINRPLSSGHWAGSWASLRPAAGSRVVLAALRLVVGDDDRRCVLAPLDVTSVINGGVIAAEERCVAARRGPSLRRMRITRKIASQMALSSATEAGRQSPVSGNRSRGISTAAFLRASALRFCKFARSSAASRRARSSRCELGGGGGWSVASEGMAAAASDVGFGEARVVSDWTRSSRPTDRMGLLQVPIRPSAGPVTV